MDKKPPIAALPAITPTEGIARLQELTERTDGLLRKAPTCEEMDAYRAALNGALLDAFGRDSDWTDRTNQAGGRGPVTFLGDPYDPVAEWHDELRAKRLLLLECIEELKRRAARVPLPPVAPPALLILENILRRFHKVAGQLRKRHGNRKTLVIKDEYDVQDLLHALLLVSFGDVRPEETAPSHSGVRPRLDFLLKAEQIVIEIKKTRESLSTADLGDELIADITRYQTHPDCKTLVCFIYDPEGRIVNVDGFTRDLEHAPSKMPVRVLVVPAH